MLSACLRRLAGGVQPRLPAGKAFVSLVTVLVTGLLLGAPSATRAEEAQAKEEFPDRFMIRGGWMYAWGANVDVTFPGPASGVGTTLDWSKTLGGTDSTNTVRIDSKYRFNERHSVGFSWYRVAFSGQNLLQQQIIINDNQIDIGAATNSSLSLNLYRLLYNYSFYNKDQVELAFSPGLYMANLKFQLAAIGNVNGLATGTALITEQLTVPLPSIGILANYHITPKLLTQMRADWFYLNVGNFEGSMMEFYFGLEYRLHKHFGLGAAYDRIIVGLENETRSGFDASLSWNLLYLYGTLYLF